MDPATFAPELEILAVRGFGDMGKRARDEGENISVVLGGPVVRENTRVVPFSVEADKCSLRTVPKIRISTREGSDGNGNYVPSREMHGGVVGRSDAVVSTTAVAGAVAPADFARAAAPADLAGTDVPAVTGMKFSAVAEVHSLAVDDGCAPLVIRTSKQRSAVVEVDPVWAGRKYRGPMDGMSVLEPLEHSVFGVPIKVGNVPNPIEHSGVSEAVDPPSASQLMMHSEVSRTIHVTIVCPWIFVGKTSGSHRMMGRPLWQVSLARWHPGL